MFSNGFGEIATRTYCHQMMDGLNAMYKMGYIHGRLKPQNLLLDKNFVLKISNFGHSQSYADYYSRNQIRINDYRAPEQLRRKPYTSKADIFAIGGILFTLYCGFAPFEAAEDTDWHWKRLSKGIIHLEKSKKYLENNPTKNKQYTVAGIKVLTSFWDCHTKKCQIDEKFQELIINMLHPLPDRRFNYEQITSHSWYNKKIMRQEEIEHFMRDRIKLVIKNRNTKVEEIVKKRRHHQEVCPNEAPCRCGRIHGKFNDNNSDIPFAHMLKDSIRTQLEKAIHDTDTAVTMNQVTYSNMTW